MDRTRQGCCRRCTLPGVPDKRYNLLKRDDERGEAVERRALKTEITGAGR